MRTPPIYWRSRSRWNLIMRHPARDALATTRTPNRVPNKESKPSYLVRAKGTICINQSKRSQQLGNIFGEWGHQSEAFDNFKCVEYDRKVQTVIIN